MKESMYIKLRSFSLLAIALLLILGCFQDNNDPNTDYDITFEINDIFDQPSNTFTQGDLIKLKLSISNITGNGVTIFTGDGCSGASYEIIDSNGVDFGKASFACLPAIPIETLFQQGDIFNQTNQWEQYTTLSQTGLPIGDYTITLSMPGLDKTTTGTVSII